MGKTVFAVIRNMIMPNKYQNEYDTSEYGGAVAGGYIGDIEGKIGTIIKPLTVMANGKYTAPKNEAYSPVTVDVPKIETVDLEAFANGNYDPPSGKAFSHVTVDVPMKEEQVKEVTVTQNGTVRVTPDNGKVLSEAVVNVNTRFDGVIALTVAKVFNWDNDHSETSGGNGTVPTYPNILEKTCTVCLSYLNLVKSEFGDDPAYWYENTDRIFKEQLSNGLYLYYIPNGSLDVNNCGYVAEYRSVNIRLTMEDGKSYIHTLLGSDDIPDYDRGDYSNKPAPYDMWHTKQMEVEQ